MTHRQRFLQVFREDGLQELDYLPLHIFGSWLETKERWATEGYTGPVDIGNLGPQLPGMGPDWEDDIWTGHGLVNFHPIGDLPERELQRDEETRLYQTSTGAKIRESLTSNSIHHTEEYGLAPTWASWERFKSYLDPATPQRYPKDLAQRLEAFAAVDRPRFFMGGSLYGYLRDWMGVEEISMIMYDEPELFAAMVTHMTDFFMAVYQPILSQVQFDVCYIFEDCCGVNGPLFSPEMYYNFFHKEYQRLFAFYRELGVEFILLDSDGKVDILVPCWLDSGVDILFPFEIGTWNTDVVALREQYGQRLMMMGGVDKHLISQGGPALERHLRGYRELVREGGFLPIPDHRISPECSYQAFLDYIEVFHQVFGNLT